MSTNDSVGVDERQWAGCSEGLRIGEIAGALASMRGEVSVRLRLAHSCPGAGEPLALAPGSPQLQAAPSGACSASPPAASSRVDPAGIPFARGARGGSEADARTWNQQTSRRSRALLARRHRQPADAADPLAAASVKRALRPCAPPGCTVAAPTPQKSRGDAASAGESRLLAGSFPPRILRALRTDRDGWVPVAGPRGWRLGLPSERSFGCPASPSHMWAAQTRLGRHGTPVRCLFLSGHDLPASPPTAPPGSRLWILHHPAHQEEVAVAEDRCTARIPATPLPESRLQALVRQTPVHPAHPVHPKAAAPRIAPAPPGGEAAARPLEA